VLIMGDVEALRVMLAILSTTPFGTHPTARWTWASASKAGSDDHGAG